MLLVGLAARLAYAKAIAVAGGPVSVAIWTTGLVVGALLSDDLAREVLWWGAAAALALFLNNVWSVEGRSDGWLFRHLDQVVGHSPCRAENVVRRESRS